MWGGGRKRTIEVSGEVYERLLELARRHNLSPGRLLEKLLLEGVTLLSPAARQQVQEGRGATPPQAGGVTPSRPVQVTLWPNDPFWHLIRVGEGFRATEISLNSIQLTKLCNTGLLAEEVCEKARRLRT
jgi:hypothetical protein